MKPLKGMLGPTDSNAPELTEAQKEAILKWREPMTTTSAQCRHCHHFYSHGYLRLCRKKPDWFCEPNRIDLSFLGEPMSDQMMGEEFGTTREQLEKSDTTEDEAGITKEEAGGLLEDVLDVLVESGNGATQEDLGEAADKLFKFRDRWFDKQ